MGAGAGEGQDYTPEDIKEAFLKLMDELGGTQGSTQGTSQNTGSRI